jgi:hypothetical protein
MDYADNREVLRNFYTSCGILESFNSDNKYLESAFNAINHLWNDNFEEIENVRFLMIAEAPMWGNDRKYFYNPEAKDSSFFRKNVLGEALGIPITNKLDFIRRCNEIGLLIVDILPYALNNNTTISYQQMRKSDYRRLLKETTPFYFRKKMMAIKKKVSNDTKVFYRYKGRVKDWSADLICPILIENGIIESATDILDVAGHNMPMDGEKLRDIINPTKQKHAQF